MNRTHYRGRKLAFKQPYRGIEVSVYWISHYPGRPNYGYMIGDGGIEIEGLGFGTTGEACRHAAHLIDGIGWQWFTSGV